MLSFVYVAIYWHNHHHLLHLHFPVDGAIMWANTHLLFWLSLIPFATAWLDETHFATLPTALYGVPLLMSAVAWFLLQGTIIRAQGRQSSLREAVGRDRKGRASIVLYVSGIGLAFIDQRFALAVYVAVALMWLIPDRRVAGQVARNREAEHARELEVAIIQNRDAIIDPSDSVVEITRRGPQ